MTNKEEWIRQQVIDYDWDNDGFGDSCIEELLSKGYERGYNDAIRWRNPKEELPEIDILVQIKTIDEHKVIAFDHDCVGIDGTFQYDGLNGEVIIGWRPI